MASRWQTTAKKVKLELSGSVTNGASVLDEEREEVVSVLPDWNSIESTTRWSDGLFWAGIVALILVAAAELAAHIYSSRAAYLVLAHSRVESETRQRQERAIEGQYSAEKASIQQELDKTSAELQRLESTNAELKSHESAKARHLLDPQTNALLKSLAPFAGQKIKVWSSDNAWDSVTLGREFIAVLKMAGWVVPDAVLSGPIAGGDTEGIRVAFEGGLSDSSQIPPGIDALISTLDRFGLVSSQTLYLDDRAHGGEYLLKIGRLALPKRHGVEPGAHRRAGSNENGFPRAVSTGRSGKAK